VLLPHVTTDTRCDSDLRRDKPSKNCILEEENRLDQPWSRSNGPSGRLTRPGKNKIEVWACLNAHVQYPLVLGIPLDVHRSSLKRATFEPSIDALVVSVLD
jgi:hypothetical protein